MVNNYHPNHFLFFWYLQKWKQLALGVGDVHQDTFWKMYFFQMFEEKTQDIDDWKKWKFHLTLPHKIDFFPNTITFIWVKVGISAKEYLH